MSPRISPASSPKLTLSTARTPPKRTVSPWTCNSAGAAVWTIHKPGRTSRIEGLLLAFKTFGQFCELPCVIGSNPIRSANQRGDNRYRCHDRQPAIDACAKDGIHDRGSNYPCANRAPEIAPSEIQPMPPMTDCTTALMDPNTSN